MHIQSRALIVYVRAVSRALYVMVLGTAGILVLLFEVGRLKSARLNDFIMSGLGRFVSWCLCLCVGCGRLSLSLSVFVWCGFLCVQVVKLACPGLGKCKLWCILVAI